MAILKYALTAFLISLSLSINGQSFFSDKAYSGDTLYDFIASWWNVPYRYGGESRRGVDCSSFVEKLIRRIYKYNLPRTAAEQYRATIRISDSCLQTGDLIFFRTHVKSGWHVGVYLADSLFVHSTSRIGVYISSLNDPRYANKVYGYGRIPHQ